MLGTGDYMRHYGAPAAQLRAEFFLDSVRDEIASQGAGREIHREVERVKIIIPGAVASIVVKNVDASHVERWPDQYRAFRAGHEAPVEGTLLAEWPILNRAMIAELNHLQIRTVEELASLSDGAVQHIGMGGQLLRQRARAFLFDAERESLNARLIAERDQQDMKIASLEKQVQELSHQMLLMAQRNDTLRNAAPPLHSYVPGHHDPLEQAKVNSQVPMVGSALDAFARMGLGRRRPPVEAEMTRSADTLYTMPVAPTMPGLPQGTEDLDHLLPQETDDGSADHQAA